MNKLFIFLFRLILGIVFAIVLLRIFYPQADTIWIVVAAFSLVGLAYITENLRKSKNNS